LTAQISEEPKEKEYRMRIKEEERKIVVGALCDKIEAILSRKGLKKEKREGLVTPLMNVLYRFTNISSGAPNRFYHWYSHDLREDVIDELKRIKEREDQR